eukprot:217185-Rhodomonas_salina.1
MRFRVMGFAALLFSEQGNACPDGGGPGMLPVGMMARPRVPVADAFREATLGSGRGPRSGRITPAHACTQAAEGQGAAVAYTLRQDCICLYCPTHSLTGRRTSLGFRSPALRMPHGAVT